MASGWYPENPTLGQLMQTDVAGMTAGNGHVAHVSWSAAQAAAADTDGVLIAHVDTGSQAIIEHGFTNPPCARNLTATAGGTAADVRAIQVIIDGTDISGEAITETLPAFTVNTAGTVVGSMAFSTVTRITIPAHDNTGATTEIGFGDKLGLPYLLPINTCLLSSLNGAKESTGATVTRSATALMLNTIDLNSALNGTAVDAFFII